VHKKCHSFHRSTEVSLDRLQHTDASLPKAQLLDEACTAARESICAAEGPRRCFSVELGNHGGEEGRAFSLFLFDYFIISGRFGANGGVSFLVTLSGVWLISHYMHA
jgi:hypothetical protein